MGERREIIVRALSVGFIILSGSFGSAVEKCLWRAEFIHLAARLARQWMKERGIIVCKLIVGFHIFSGSFGSAVDKRTRTN